jgi:hypothetical protein
MSVLNYILIAVAVLAVLVAGLVVWSSRKRVDELQAIQADQIRDLQDELATVLDRLEKPQPQGSGVDGAVLITQVGDEPPETTVSDRIVLSATIGEPLVKTAAMFHGLRRALAPETRNRIRFEMKREVRRARKQRRQDMKTAYRQMREGDLGERRTA